MILCRNPSVKRLWRNGPARVGTVIQTDRFTDRHARHYINLYKTKGGPEAKKWALTVLSAEPRAMMVTRVNELLKKSN